MFIFAIVNPTSGRGKARAAWESVRSRLSVPSETRETQRPGHATELAAEAIRGGARTIVAVGGDGTIHEVVNGFFERDRLISDAVTLAFVPGQGTGGDFQRMFRFPAACELAARLVCGEPRPVDVLKVRYTNAEGSSASRYSINVTSFGMGGSVAARVAVFPKPLGGTVRFLMATLHAAFSFKGAPVRIRIDESLTIDLTVTNVAIANGRYHGGGMLACPQAAIDDGLIDVTIVPFMPLLELVRNLPRLYNGGIHGHPKVTFFRARRVQADSEQVVPLEIDGEAVGCLPVEISIVPRAIPLLV